MSDLEKAVEIIGGPKLAQGDTDWFSIVDLLANLARMLLFGQGCRPTPVELHAQLTRQYRPIERLFGAERRRDRRIREAIAANWDGRPEILPQIQASTLAACKAGRFTPELIAGVYRDAPKHR